MKPSCQPVSPTVSIPAKRIQQHTAKSRVEKLWALQEDTIPCFDLRRYCLEITTQRTWKMNIPRLNVKKIIPPNIPGFRNNAHPSSARGANAGRQSYFGLDKGYPTEGRSQTERLFAAIT